MKLQYSLTIESCVYRDRRGNARWVPIELAPPTIDSLADDARLRWVVAGVPVIDAEVWYADGYLLAIVDGVAASLEHREFRRDYLGDSRTPLGFTRQSPTECMITLEAETPVRVCAHLRRLAESVLDPIERAAAHTGWIDTLIGGQGEPDTTWKKQMELARAAFVRFEARNARVRG